MSTPCPCGLGSYHSCCEPFHCGKKHAPTPEALMRSRYSAFVLNMWGYLIATHHPGHLHGLTESILAEGPQPQWRGLTVHDSHSDTQSGEVFFTAWYLEAGKLDGICERSLFVFEEGQWFYTKGKQYAPKLPGRNDTCVCGSGKKLKHCCLKSQ
ncbi:YchJ family protein [Shewanella zhangzhouensis]|uniref:YchJ family protein n=1 Tax=Shewanella zhangzhouensis TaxID=2864213 RepID=UPI001C659607|nr:YchJ family metal-binding protein [Shewanella zhangzhouensis]QYK03485.1 SEC-C domain-containing protein [Shewanella zhangzhouensis]